MQWLILYRATANQFEYVTRLPNGRNIGPHAKEGYN